MNSSTQHYVALGLMGLSLLTGVSWFGSGIPGAGLTSILLGVWAVMFETVDVGIVGSSDE